jgi:hypothetical protein
MDICKIKCAHDYNGKPCIGTLSFLFKGNGILSKSSETTQEMLDNFEIAIEAKCTCCKRKTFILFPFQSETFPPEPEDVFQPEELEELE